MGMVCKSRSRQSPVCRRSRADRIPVRIGRSALHRWLNDCAATPLPSPMDRRRQRRLLHCLRSQRPSTGPRLLWRGSGSSVRYGIADTGWSKEDCCQHCKATGLATQATNMGALTLAKMPKLSQRPRR